MTSPNLTLAASQTRTEDETRELAKVYRRTEKEYCDALHAPNLSFTEDQHVDNLITIEHARTTMNAAYLAFRASMKDAI